MMTEMENKIYETIKNDFEDYGECIVKDMIKRAGISPQKEKGVVSMNTLDQIFMKALELIYETMVHDLDFYSIEHVKPIINNELGDESRCWTYLMILAKKVETAAKILEHRITASVYHIGAVTLSMFADGRNHPIIPTAMLQHPVDFVYRHIGMFIEVRSDYYDYIGINKIKELRAELFGHDNLFVIDYGCKTVICHKGLITKH